MRRETSDGQTSDWQCAGKCIPPAYDGEHTSGRFRGFAGNDNRAAKQPGFREFRRFRGCGIAYGDDYKVSVTGLPLASPALHDVEQKAPSLGRSLRYVL